SNQPPQLKLAGTVTVYEAFSVFGQPIRVQLGKKVTTLMPDQRGMANARDAAFRVLSEHKDGVVYGGVLDFEIVLRGPDWLGEIKDAAGSQVPVSMELTVGNVRHSAAIPLDRIVKGDLSRQ